MDRQTNEKRMAMNKKQENKPQIDNNQAWLLRWAWKHVKVQV